MVRLSDYQPPAYVITDVDLTFDLDPDRTLVTGRYQVRRGDGPAGPLRLDAEDLTVRALAVDGAARSGGTLTIQDGAVLVHELPDTCTVEIVSEIVPSANTKLDGLYLSGGRFCTQCEAEGFRRIIPFIDRPDNLSRFTVRVEADKGRYPTLLSNGDEIERGDLQGGRHFAVFRDPHLKPAYLFALVAGEFETITDRFETMSGKTVDLAIHVDPGDGARAHFAMDALKRSFKWDEERFKREYDLSVFHIVAVRDFNYGAMENKGLNVFNSSLLLVDPDTATDADFLNVERVIAHEYFHNWTGNRITLRDWFQLCLKEGLTVYRDQEFSSDERNRALQRIMDVETLRSIQFPEDSGPLAHPPRPEAYETIDNFYTSTVYRKGAEVVRVLSEVVGAEAFDRGMQRYFDACDGKAATLEDFVGAFDFVDADAKTRFFRWYQQAGTPEVSVQRAYDAAAGTLTLDVSQTLKPTPGQTDKAPHPIPLRIGFIDKNGRTLAARHDGGAPQDEHRLLLEDRKGRFVFEGFDAEPIPAVLRGFNAPVELKDGLNSDARLVQMAHEPDPFTRWDAGQTLLRDAVLARAGGASQAGPAVARIADALRAEFARTESDPGLTARALRVPSLSDLLLSADAPDPEALYEGRRAVRAELAEALADAIDAEFARPAPAGDALDNESIGRRALRGALLHLLAATREAAAERVQGAFASARNMTETMSALVALEEIGGAARDAALDAFHGKWKSNPLVMDKWFSVQAASPRPGAADRVRALSDHPLFTLANPNRVRALYGAFANANPRWFHAADGSGYELVADAIAKLDKTNPMTSARLVRAFETWSRFDADRQAKAKAALETLRSGGVSTNLKEMVDRTLG